MEWTRLGTSLVCQHTTMDGHHFSMPHFGEPSGTQVGVGSPTISAYQPMLRELRVTEATQHTA